MGFDKSQLNFHGEPQVVWLNTLLPAFCHQVFVSGSPARISGQFNFIEDYYETGGPLNGILSAFRQYPSSAWLVIPVDMPNLNEEVIAFLLKQRNQNKLATCFVTREGNIEPLPVILESSAYPILLNKFSQGDASLNRFLKNEFIARIAIPNMSWLDNVNTPSQLSHPNQNINA